MKRFAAVIVLVAVLAVTAMAAQDPGPDPGPFGPCGPGRPGGPAGFGPGPEMGIVRMVEDLNLSLAQKRQVAQILKDDRDQAKTLHEAMKKAHENMRAVMDKTPGDEAQVRLAAQAISKAGEDLAVNAGKIKAKIDAALNPEQKARVAEKRERMEKGPRTVDEWIEQTLK